jgi:hypothetical protein
MVLPAGSRNDDRRLALALWRYLEHLRHLGGRTEAELMLHEAHVALVHRLGITDLDDPSRLVDPWRVADDLRSRYNLDR